MMSGSLPNFSNKTALIAHAPDSNVDALVSQLRRLKISSDCQWPVKPDDMHNIDMVFFDTDNGYDAMFPWSSVPPVPLIALSGSETPGRLEWAMRQRPSAYILKPIGSKGVFLALVTAFRAFNIDIEKDTLIANLEERLRCRPIVVNVILRLMKAFNIEDDQAFRILRSEAMQRKITIEQCCHEIFSLSDLPGRLVNHLSIDSERPSATGRRG